VEEYNVPAASLSLVTGMEHCSTQPLGEYSCQWLNVSVYRLEDVSMRPTLNYQRKKFAMLAVLICSLLLLALPITIAQEPHGGPPPPGEQDDMHGPPPPGPPDGPRSTMRGGLQLGPPGRWWDDKVFAQDLGLTAAQARRMDEIFQANRETLLRLYRSVQHEESTLEQLTTGNHLREEQIFQQIDRVSAARAALEKASAHMQLEIRRQMTAGQTARLDQHRPKPPR
jgi:Spy/CpxP family protein refolding chaperone